MLYSAHMKDGSKEPTITDVLKAIQFLDQKFEKRFSQSDKQFAGIDQRFIKIDKQFEEVGHRFDDFQFMVNFGFSKAQEQVTELDERLSGKLDHVYILLDSKAQEHLRADVEIAALLHRTKRHDEQIAALEQKGFRAT